MDMPNNSMVDRVNERFRRTLTGMPASVDLSAAKNAAECVVERLTEAQEALFDESD